MHSTVAGKKVCCVCGKDVTHERRMKDAATGRYWCYTCGAAEKTALHSGVGGLAVPCPQCNKLYAPQQMYKVKEHYICEHCYNATENKEGRKGKSSPDNRKQVTIAIGVAAIIVGAVLLALHFTDML